MHAGVTTILDQCKKDLELILKQPVTVRYSVQVNFITAEQITQEICKHFNFTWSQIISESREQEFKVPRQLFCWLCWHYLKWDQSRIAGQINRERSIVSKSVPLVTAMINNNDELYTIPLQMIERNLFANESIES